jgi:hypothetical protein
MTDPVKMRRLRDAIGARLAEISDFFTEPVKLTIVVRNPAHPDGSRDVYVTDDDAELAIAAIRRVVATGEATPAEVA